MAKRGVQTFYVKVKADKEGNQPAPRLIKGTQKQVEALILAEHEIRPAEDHEINALGREGVTIEGCIVNVPA